MMMMTMMMTMATTMIMRPWRPLRTRCFFALELVSICNNQQKTSSALYVRASEVLPLRGQVRPPRSTKRWALANLRSFWLDARPQDNGEGQGPCLSWSHASADRRDERGAAPLKRLRREKLQSRRGARPTPRAGSGHRADVANNPTTTARVNETVRMGRRPRQREVYFRDAVTAAMQPPASK